MKFLADFPEDLFDIVNSKEYINNIVNGELKATQSSVLICGICRNIGDVFNLSRLRIEEIGSMFGDYRVFVYENDSTDETKDNLIKWASQNDKVSVLLEDVQEEWYNTGFSQDRLTAMANARNKYLDYTRDIQTDYTIIVDLDVIGGFSYNGIKNSIGILNSTDIDMIGGNSLLYRDNGAVIEKLYYDTFAYRDLNEEYQGEEISSPIKNLMSFECGEYPFEVESCFGGIGIYKGNIEHNYDNTDCDHVTLHKKMREDNKKIYLNPSMVSLYNDTIYTYGVTKKEFLRK